MADSSPPEQPKTPTTAERLVEYRDELLAAGFPPEDVAVILRYAGGRPDLFVTDADRVRAHQDWMARHYWLLQGVKGGT